MSKIYELKTEDNWFIGKWGGYGAINKLGQDTSEDLWKISREFDNIHSSDEDNYDVVVIKKNSDFALISFIADMMNQEKQRQIKVTQHQGAILLTEAEKLLTVFLPKGGLLIQDFFGEKSKADFGDTILIATKNEGKTKEFRQFFEKLGYQVENLNAYPDLPDVAETGMTFEENARLKAETIANLTGKMVLADDSGLKVDVLGGLPGVWSARFSGPEATDESNNAKLLHELAMVFEQKDRSAQFHCTLVIAAPNRDSLVVEADWDGYIGFDAKGEHGFGYDPLFLVGETGQTSAQLSLEEKNQQSHRAKALEKLVEAFPVWQGQIAQP